MKTTILLLALVAFGFFLAMEPLPAHAPASRIHIYTNGIVEIRLP